LAGETCRWAATQGKAKVMDDKIEPRRSPCPRRQSAIIEALGENASTAKEQHRSGSGAPRPLGEPAAPPAADR
jgi:hypothetical protein